MTKTSPWPGSQPPTPREIQAANRRLLTAMKRQKDAKRRLATADRDLREARALVRKLIDLLAQGVAAPAPAGPICEECDRPLGSNAHCLICQAHGMIVTPTSIGTEGGAP